MAYTVDFVNVSTVGLESSPVVDALAGLRANEARYFKNKYDHVFTVEPASKAKKTVDWVHRILEGRARPRHRVAAARGDGVRGRRHPLGYVFYESGLSINVMYTLEDGGQAGGRLQALRRDGDPGRARLALQVRPAEVEAGRHHPRLVLRDQGRVLTRSILRSCGHDIRMGRNH